MELFRLDKFISSQSEFTRSQSRKLIASGRVKVEGMPLAAIDTKVNPLSDKIFIDGKEICYKKYVYYLLNKPKGVLSASNDKNKKTVVDLLKDRANTRNLFPVGRLDKDTTGLLIITDDGETAHRIISPKSMIEKLYIAELDGTPSKNDINIFKNGVVLADGSKCAPADLEVLSDNKAAVKITEGKYHQIKRMFGVIGLGVINLHRKSIGKMTVPDSLKAGEYKEITINDIEKFIFN